nr:hypothetical protein GCM10017745_44640 [Saccharothrix mutabilis subsp. capreolus]
MSAAAEFGRGLRALRTSAGLTQAALGRLLGYHHSLISKVEAGTRRPPPDLAGRCARLLGDHSLLPLWSALEDERRAGPGDVVAALTGVAAYERFNDGFGGVPLIPALEGQLRTVTAWLAADADPALPGLAAGLAFRCGWARVENGQHRAGTTWLTRSVGWARAAHDRTTAGTALTYLGVVALVEGRPGPAGRLAARARAEAPGDTTVDFLASLLESRAHAANDADTSCRRALDRAERLSTDLRALPPRHGLMLLDAGKAACFRDLAVRRGAPALARRAVEHAREALRRTPVDSRPSRALFTVRLADAYACAAEPESAVAAAEPTVDAPWGGDLVRRELAGLKRRLVARWGRVREVRRFADLIP